MSTRVIVIFTAVLYTFCLTSCTNKDNEERKITDYKEVILTVASNKVPGVLYDEYSILSEVYAVRKDKTDRWNTYGYIAGFEYEEGYEYKIKVSETTYLDYSMGDPSWTERNLLEIISKDKKDSDGLPLHLIPENYYKNIPLPRYRYVVEADNNELTNCSLRMAEWSAAANGHFWMKTETRQAFLHSIYFRICRQNKKCRSVSKHCISV